MSDSKGSLLDRLLIEIINGPNKHKMKSLDLVCQPKEVTLVDFIQGSLSFKVNLQRMFSTLPPVWKLMTKQRSYISSLTGCTKQVNKRIDIITGLLIPINKFLVKLKSLLLMKESIAFNLKLLKTRNTFGISINVNPFV